VLQIRTVSVFQNFTSIVSYRAVQELDTRGLCKKGVDFVPFFIFRRNLNSGSNKLQGIQRYPKADVGVQVGEFVACSVLATEYVQRCWWNDPRPRYPRNIRTAFEQADLVATASADRETEGALPSGLCYFHSSSYKRLMKTEPVHGLLWQGTVSRNVSWKPSDVWMEAQLWLSWCPREADKNTRCVTVCLNA
jgi:hypothetical protein